MSQQTTQSKYTDLAHTLLLVDENNKDLVLKYLDILTNGLPPNKKSKKKIIIAGAGISGLLAGSLLKAAGHDIQIIEANPKRIGGRLKTFHSPSEREHGLDSDRPSPFKDPVQYGEAGAMRLPDFHPLVLTLIDKLKLNRRLFYNVSVEEEAEEVPIPPVEYETFITEDQLGTALGTQYYPKDNIWKSPYKPVGTYKETKKIDNTFIKTNDTRVRKYEYNEKYEYGKYVAEINKGFCMENLKETTSTILKRALDKVRQHINRNTIEGKIQGWAYVIENFDKHSMWSFLKEYSGLSDEEIEAIGTIENLTSRLALSFFHSFLGRSDINPNVKYWELEGGTWRLPYAFLGEGDTLGHGKGLAPLKLGEDIIVDRRIIKMEYEIEKDDEKDDLYDTQGVTFETVIESKFAEGESPDKIETNYQGEYAIVTLPFSSLRHVQIEPAFSYKKRRAIIELHYDAATKVLLEFSHRWWEMGKDEFEKIANEIRSKVKTVKKVVTDGVSSRNVSAIEEVEYIFPWLENPKLRKFYRSLKEKISPASRSVGEANIQQAMKGGGSVTDNPNRFVYFPSHQIEDSKGGVVLASYSWSDDARRWDAMIEAERYLFALRNMQSIFGEDIAFFYTGRGQTESWATDPYAFGEAAVFTPGQLSAFHLDIPTNEGNVYFAGEHVSLKHAWIEGCLETAIQAALDIHERD